MSGDDYEPLAEVFAEMQAEPWEPRIKIGRDARGAFVLEVYDGEGEPEYKDGECVDWRPSFWRVAIDEQQFRNFCAAAHVALALSKTGTLTGTSSKVHFIEPLNLPG